MNKTACYLVLCSLFILLANGCASKRISDHTTNSDITTGEWILVSVRASIRHDFLSPELEYMPTLKIGDNGTYSGFDSCNRFSGKLVLGNDSIKFFPAISTLKACLDNFDVDNLLRTAFELVDNYSIKGDKLYLKKDSESMIIYRRY